ncbi:hypothetical protein EXU57_16125 [Segetibacter sp. 3557_3]|uniref:hypothetical protein n=1 Tax=Segetibacter sp. 3557_3 TaxID=2547429 RepID=UPI0010590264|nr:hypothetical protein [Segetibacter sp. 3557_3]TDH24013.1 hypothetical protein EXU57_16125 [Segetibacter sp. 3557_3]
MKSLLIALSMCMALTLSSKTAEAQITTGEQVLAAAGNLIAVQVGTVAINVQDITITDVVDVSNVLNNNTVTIVALNDILNDLTIDNVLNNLLRDANIITGNQVVVGVTVLGGVVDQVVVAQKDILKQKKGK